MKASQIAVRELSSALREFGVRQEDEDGAEVFFIEDASVVFGLDDSGQRVFQGLSFEMVARDFHVLPNLDLVVTETPVNSSESEAYVVNDSKLTAHASSYLLWRAGLLKDLQV